MESAAVSGGSCMIIKTLRFGAALLVAALSLPVAAQELTEQQQLDATEFAVNNAMFIMEHEIGHLFVAEFGLPVLGKEEDAADSLAALLLLAQQTDEGNQALIDSADGWYLSDAAKAEWEDSDFYDEHSLDIQRAYQIVCLMVGADADVFGEVATEYEMDAERQERCAFDYQQASSSWTGLLEPHEGSSDPSRISIVYEDGGEDYGDIAQLLQDVRFMEGAAQSITANYTLPRDLTFRAKACGEENAWYSYDEAEITFCYELVALFFHLIEQDMKANAT